VRREALFPLRHPVRRLAAICATAVLALLAVAAPSIAQDEPAPGDASPFRFERQLRVNPFDPAALNNLAVVKAGQGRYEDAMDLLHRAARLAPDNAVIRANVGRLKAWKDTLGTPDPLAEPELSLSQVPPEPPRLWNATPP
jgi:tetratricopeptide (TPR) repeat protein